MREQKVWLENQRWLKEGIHKIMNGKNKIIFLVNSGDYSGAEKVNLEIIAGLQKRYEFCYASEKGIIDEYLSDMQIEHIIVSKMNRKEILRIEREYHPALFHATDYHVSVVCALAGIKTPFLSHLHNNCPWLNKLHPYTLAYLYAGYRAAKILTVSESIEEEYLFSKCIRKKIICLSNPVGVKNLKKYQQETQKKRYDICFTGRLTEQKNPRLLLEIIEDLKKRKKDLSAVIVGDGELREEIEQTIKEKGLMNHVELVGFQKDPYRYMQQSKVFCLPSKWEGYGLAAFEALAVGLPCYVSPVGGLVNVVTEECGAFCRTKKEFCEEIGKILKEPEEYEEKSRKAEERAERLDNMEEYMEKVADIYETII